MSKLYKKCQALLVAMKVLNNEHFYVLVYIQVHIDHYFRIHIETFHKQSQVWGYWSTGSRYHRYMLPHRSRHPATSRFHIYKWQGKYHRIKSLTLLL